MNIQAEKLQDILVTSVTALHQFYMDKSIDDYDVLALCNKACIALEDVISQTISLKYGIKEEELA